MDRLFVPAATVDFAFSFVELPLTAPFLPISYGASPFHQLRRVKECLKNAFVRLKLQENGYSIQSKPLTIQIFPYRYPPKETTQSRLAQILRKTIAPPRNRRNEQPIPPIMKNVRYKPNNPTETRTIPARTQSTQPYSELASNDSTGYRIPKLPQTRGSRYAPPQRIPIGVRRGVGEG